MTETPLDKAHAAMMATPEDDAARLVFFGTLAASELFLLLAKDPVGDQIEPRTFKTEDGTYACIFDREDRLASFAEGPAPYAAISCRALASLLSGSGIGLLLNPSFTSSFALASGGLEWLQNALSSDPTIATATPTEIFPPKVPENLLRALDAKLASARDLATCAYLAEAKFETGHKSMILAFLDAQATAHTALANAMHEALVFSGSEAGRLDVIFVNTGSRIVEKLEKYALRFDLPERELPKPPKPPGFDPEVPPKLR